MIPGPLAVVLLPVVAVWLSDGVAESWPIVWFSAVASPVESPRNPRKTMDLIEKVWSKLWRKTRFVFAWIFLPRQVRLDRTRKRLHQQYEKDRKALTDAADRAYLRHNYLTELHALHAEEEDRFTQRLVRKANGLRVPVPPHFGEDGEFSEYWNRGPYGDTVYLTKEGIAIVRKAIREEEEWRMKKRGHWVPWITALTGLVGTGIGFITALATLAGQ